MSTLLVLGASSDIAKATARLYARKGYDIVLAGRNVEELSRDATDMHIRFGAKTTAIPFDALDVSTHQKFYDALSPKPDGVLCAVGYLGSQSKGEQTLAEAQTILQTNFLGCVSILSVIANSLEKRRSGFIIGISSVAGDRGRRSNYLYGSAKAGLSAFLSGLRSRLSRSNVQVLTVKPGFVATRMTESLDLPPLLTTAPEAVAHDIMNAQIKGRNVIYTRWFWRWIMMVIRLIPEFVFKKLPL